jgi:histidine ammonia-lyase
VIATLRKHVPSLAADRILSGDLDAAEAWARDGEWREALATTGVALR